ncbi:MAG: tetratricopeptide repeat-containing sulfotransferase family protein, partial [Acetobacteraceae bacterium]
DHLIAQAASGGQRKKPSAADQKAVQAFLRKVDREARPLGLNMFKRAKLANAFKWRLLEKGAEPEKVDELTQMLLLQLATNGASAAQTGIAVTAAAPKRANAGKVDSLLAQAIEFDKKKAYTDAIRSYQELLELDPRHAVAHNNLGATFINVGRYREAEHELRRAIEIKRNYPDALYNLATLLRMRGLIFESETPLRRAVKSSPQHVNARVGLGLTLILAGRFEDATDCFERALKMAPRNANALTGLGEIAGFEGRFKDAEALFGRALEFDPTAATALAAIPGVRKMTRADATWLKGAERIVESGPVPLDEANLRFAIGKYYDDVGDFGSAFRNYRRGNELLKAAAEPYDRSRRVSFVDDMLNVYTQDALSSIKLGASESERPVFVVGMMRSGTSLVEQIISSHPRATGAGELDFWNKTVWKHEDALRRELPGESRSKTWAQDYLRTLGIYSQDSVRVVDKSTLNSDHLGVIHSTFPRARFLYIRRNPIDTCLSCYFSYFQQFASTLNFTMDLSDLAHYYREHRRVIDHWRSVLPHRTFLEVPYAELVADPEIWTRRILAFLELPWDRGCLDFNQNRRRVLTASSWQVRQKVYATSVGRWRNYEKHIGPLRDLATLD